MKLDIMLVFNKGSVVGRFLYWMQTKIP